MIEKEDDLGHLPEWKQERIKSSYHFGFGVSSTAVEDYIIDIDKRLKQLEHKVFKQNKRMQITLAQKILALQQLGILAHFKDLGLSNNMTAKLMAILLNEDADRIEKFNRNVGLKTSNLNTIENYEVLLKMFEDLGFEKEEVTAQNKLNQLKAAKGR